MRPNKCITGHIRSVTLSPAEWMDDLPSFYSILDVRPTYSASTYLYLSPEHVKEQKEEYSRHGLLADGTSLPFYGILKLDIRLRQIKTTEVFIISQINEGANLGMPFLAKRKCAMDFHRPLLRLYEQVVKCTNRQGRHLASHVPAVKGEVLPPETEMAIMCRVTSRNYCPWG